MPTPNGPQFRRVVHLSENETPPHTVDHPWADVFGQGMGDRAASNAVLFTADEVDTSDLVRKTGRRFAHTYEVPEELMSIERFGDDDLTGAARTHFSRTDSPELWEGTPASRKDAVERNQVIRFTNHYELPGKNSYIMPKSLIQGGAIRYAGSRDAIDDNE